MKVISIGDYHCFVYFITCLITSINMFTVEVFVQLPSFLSLIYSNCCVCIAFSSLVYWSIVICEELIMLSITNTKTEQKLHGKTTQIKIKDQQNTLVFKKHLILIILRLQCLLFCNFHVHYASKVQGSLYCEQMCLCSH